MKTWIFHALETICDILAIVKDYEPEAYKHWVYIR